MIFLAFFAWIFRTFQLLAAEGKTYEFLPATIMGFLELFVAVGLVICLALSWINSGILLDETGIVEVNFLGRCKKRILYKDFTGVELPSEDGGAYITYTITATLNRKMRIPEQMPEFLEVWSEIALRIKPSNQVVSKPISSTKELGRFRTRQFGYLKQMTVPVVYGLLMTSIPFRHMRTPEDTQTAWSAVGLWAVFVVVIASMPLRKYLNERLIVYEDRLERIAPNGKVTACIRFDAVRYFDRQPWSQYFVLESATNHLFVHRKSGAVHLLEEQLETQGKLEAVRRQTPLYVSPHPSNRDWFRLWGAPSS